MVKEPSDEKLMDGVRNDDRQSFDGLFRRYYRMLVLSAIKYVVDQFVAEELVQDLFLNLWQKRKILAIAGKVKAYLFVAIKNRCLNYLKTRFARQDFVEVSETHLRVHSESADGDVAGLRKAIDQGIARLPEKCRHIFLLSRRAGMSYQEIAEELDISRKTVEAQMGIALKRLREFINDYQKNG